MVRMMTLAAAKSPLHHTIQAGHSSAKAIAPHFTDVRGLVNEFMACLQWPIKFVPMWARATACTVRCVTREPELPKPRPRALLRLLGLHLTVTRRRIGLQRRQQAPGAVGDFGNGAIERLGIGLR